MQLWCFSNIKKENKPTGFLYSFVQFAIGNDDTSYKIIVRSLQLIDDLFDEFKNKQDESYAETLDDMYNYIREWTEAVFRAVIARYDVSGKNVDRLEFDLNQDELSVLLHLITQAEFLKFPKTGDYTKFTTFCEKYFYCRKKGKVGFNPMLGAVKRIGDAKNGNTSKPLAKVIKRINEAHNTWV